MGWFEINYEIIRKIFEIKRTLTDKISIKVEFKSKIQKVVSSENVFTIFFRSRGFKSEFKIFLLSLKKKGV